MAIMAKPLVHEINENDRPRNVQKPAVTIPLASRVKFGNFIEKGLGSQLIDLAAVNPRRASAKHGSPSATRGTPQALRERIFFGLMTSGRQLEASREGSK